MYDIIQNVIIIKKKKRSESDLTRKVCNHGNIDISGATTQYDINGNVFLHGLKHLTHTYKHTHLPIFTDVIVRNGAL